MSSARYEIQGQTVTLPCIVRDAGSGNAIFMVPTEGVRRLIPGDAFEVVEAAPGQTQCILAIIDYRDNDLGDYDEVGIIFTVRPRGAAAEASGTFIYKLPVNQSLKTQILLPTPGPYSDRHPNRLRTATGLCSLDR